METNQTEKGLSAEVQQTEEVSSIESEHSYKLVLSLLGDVKYSQLSHAACRTSEESASVRGVSIDSGAKAMLLRNDKEFILCVMSASKKLSWKAIRSYVGNKKLTMATADEVFAVTKCLPGAVPPFGSIYTIKTLTDPSLQIQGPTINFNCGLRTQSISMQTHDYLAIEKPTIVSFTE